MSFILDDGNALRFGQDIEEVERIYGVRAGDLPFKNPHQDTDKWLDLPTMVTRFDSGRLKEFKFKAGYQFTQPLVPYPDEWRNLGPIESLRISAGMRRDDFLNYVAAWEKRATENGARKLDLWEMTGNDFSVGIMESETWNSVCMNMGPRRLTRAGGIWCDGWIVEFKPSGTDPNVLVLHAITAFRDEFNSAGRRAQPLQV